MSDKSRGKISHAEFLSYQKHPKFLLWLPQIVENCCLKCIFNKSFNIISSLHLLHYNMSVQIYHQLHVLLALGLSFGEWLSGCQMWLPVLPESDNLKLFINSEEHNSCFNVIVEPEGTVRLGAGQDWADQD